MTDRNRRDFLSLASGAAALGALPASIQRALAAPASNLTGTIADVQHVVILMQENRSFNHYFGTLKGVRGFGDRHTVPMAGGKSVWRQSDGAKDIPPYHLDSFRTSALKVPGTPHAFDNAQAAWNQGKFGFWPKYKTRYSMGYYTRDDIPFQFALAEAFTLCDAYHCSVTSGTDPNRVAFFSGSSFDPAARARGENCTEDNSEPNNLRCWITGALPDPGYKYAGSDLTWPTIPEVLQKAGVSWRIYQDPNNNFTGAMHGGLAFAGFRKCKPGDPIYENGMRDFSLDRLAEDVKADKLPQVSWILPSTVWSEHPSVSSPVEGAEYVSRILDALTSNPEVWSKTAFFIFFDENDGHFDHVPPPAPPSYNADGTLAGAATLDLKGEYFSDPQRKYLKADDTISGNVRPWGLGPRLPLYVISPWSKGGFVCSQVFDHTSIGQFLEKRFKVTIPAISPWHRAVCGDLTAAFDFATPNDPKPAALPLAKGSAAVVAKQKLLPPPEPPATPQLPKQERGVRPSRALPYELQVDGREKGATLELTFRNTGKAGAVFHLYDRRALERIPRRYTVEAGKTLADTIAVPPRYDLWILGPNGFMREFTGTPGHGLTVQARSGKGLELSLRNSTATPMAVGLRANAYGVEPATVIVLPGTELRHTWPVADSGNWYDVTVAYDLAQWRFAGRIETGKAGVSDPAMGT